jgi:cyclophilin family peptidyl-prolyl cis-trans isomerase
MSKQILQRHHLSRVIDGFMIQGGGFDAQMNKKPTRAPIKNEADNGLTNDAYTVAMARTNIPDSATAQFFLNVANNTFLNHTAKTPQGWGYAVFGKVIKGREVVDKIKAVPLHHSRLMKCAQACNHYKGHRGAGIAAIIRLVDRRHSTGSTGIPGSRSWIDKLPLYSYLNRHIGS